MGQDPGTVTEDVVRRFREGDPDAAVIVYRALSGPVYGYLLRQMRDREAAQDVTGEAFVEALEAAHRFEGPPRGLQAWVFRIARNRMIDHLRRESHRRHPSLESLAEAGREPAAGDDPEAETLGLLERERILASMEQLTADQRDVVLLRLVADLSVAETAELMDRSSGAVRVLQHRALRALAEAMEPDVGPRNAQSPPSAPADGEEREDP